MDRLTAERMFVKVVETGSFAAAAARLGTSSGQASKLVARLEAMLGVKLLNRTTRALALTEAGRTCAERLRRLIDDYDELQAEMQQAAVVPRGLLRLSVPLSYGTVRLAPHLAAFAARYPDISLDVQFADRMVNLVDEGFDAAIRVGAPREPGLVARKLCTVQLLLIAAPSYLDRAGVPVSPEALTAQACIIDTNHRDPGHWPLARGLRVPVSGRLSFSNASACVTAAEQGLGIACVPDFVAEPSLAAGRVRRILEDHAASPRGVYAIYPEGRNVPAKLRVLIDFMAQALKTDSESEGMNFRRDGL